MKKILKKIFFILLPAVLLVSVLAVTLSACILNNVDVGISMPSRSLPRWQLDAKYLTEAFEKEGYTSSVLYAGDNVELQLRDIETFISKNVKLIYISPVDASKLDQVCQKAHDAGIKIIAHDRMIEDTNFIDYFVTFDSAKVGASCAQFIVDKLDLDGANKEKTFNIEIVGGDPGDPNAKSVYNGGMDILDRYITTNAQLKVLSGKIDFEDIATAKWNKDIAKTNFKTLYQDKYLGTPNKLDAVFCSNDSTAQGVAAALTELDVEIEDFPIITGQDCDIDSVKNMIAGKQSMSVFKDMRTIAAEDFKVGLALLQGETPVTQTLVNNGTKNVPTVICSITVCTKDGGKIGSVTTSSIEMALINSGLYTKSQLGL